MKPSIFILLLLAVGCAGSSTPTIVSTVHAAPPSPAAAVTTGCHDPNFKESEEHPGSEINLIDYPCALLLNTSATSIQSLDSAGKDQVVELTTTAPIHIHSIRLWIGAGIGSTFETGINLELIPPAGQKGYKRFIREWDKHKEEHFDDAPFPVDINLDAAGWLIRLSRDPHSTIACNDIPAKTCVTQEMAQLFGD
jgi:hypothetical protein